MRRYLIDTPLIAAYLANRPSAVTLMRPWMAQREAATSLLIYGELVEYLKRLPDFPKRCAQLRQLLREVYPYFLTYAILERYADIRRRLRPPHGPGLIGDIDTLIAATALENNLRVVTTDRDFERVPALQVRLVSLKS